MSWYGQAINKIEGLPWGKIDRYAVGMRMSTVLTEAPTMANWQAIAKGTAWGMARNAAYGAGIGAGLSLLNGDDMLQSAKTGAIRGAVATGIYGGARMAGMKWGGRLPHA
jgi:hypothetical protein